MVSHNRKIWECGEKYEKYRFYQKYLHGKTWDNYKNMKI